MNRQSTWVFFMWLAIGSSLPFVKYVLWVTRFVFISEELAIDYLFSLSRHSLCKSPSD